MKSLLTLWLFTLTAFLSACGGGGSSAPMESTNCDSTTLWAARPALYGAGIPDNNLTGITVTWDNQNCAVRTITSAALELCLSHTRPTDLTWTIIPPSGTPLDLIAPTNWNSTTTACDSGQGKFQRIDLLQNLPHSLPSSGTWRLQVTDTLPGDEGALIQWRLLIEGYR